MKFVDWERYRTITYQPAPNRSMERFYGHLKASSMAKNSSYDWLNHLSRAVLGIRTTIKSDLDTYSAKRVHVLIVRALSRQIPKLAAGINFISACENRWTSYKPSLNYTPSQALVCMSPLRILIPLFSNKPHTRTHTPQTSISPPPHPQLRRFPLPLCVLTFRA